jgi:phosphate:Na+ symporter
LPGAAVRGRRARTLARRGGAAIDGTILLLNLLGGVALLLWGMRMVENGVNQAFGADLRRMIGLSMRNPVLAMLVGLGATGLLQSSTATALITASFARQGLVETAPALAVMLGADVGTSLVVQVLSFDLSWLSPLLIAAGVIGFKTSRAALRQHVSRAVIGLGLILLALREIVSVSEPLRHAAALQSLLEAIGGEPLLLVLVAALVTWLAHSSLATVLLIASLVASGVVSLEMGFAMVLGANLGGGLPQITATLGSTPEVRRIPLGNLLFKLTGVVVAVPLLRYVPEAMAAIGGSPARLIAHFHMVFNLGLMLAFLFFTRPVAGLLRSLLPDVPGRDNPAEPLYLDRSAIENPTLALAHAERETLRMGDVVQSMVARTLDVLRFDDERLLQEVVKLDDTVDALHQAIKFYLTDISREPMNEKDSSRAQEIISFTINLEHIGDIVDKNLMELAAKKIRHKAHFSDEGFVEISNLHRRLLENFKLAFAVFMSDDVEMARRLLTEKARFRQLEQEAAESHLARLRINRMESIDTSSIHLDILNEFRRINSHLASSAYPILERAGELFTSRLKPSA